MTTNAIAGPSSRPYFPPPFRVDDWFPPTGSGSTSRASTPSAPTRPKAVPSLSSITDKRRNEIINKHRHESAQRLKSAWELLLEKYGHVRPEEDDEIDLVTGKVTKYRGGLLEFREEGGELPGENSDEGDNDSLAQFESDEDELGGWDNRSGLDDQGLEEFREEERRAVQPWDEEDPFDRMDREEFLRMEALQQQELREQGKHGDPDAVIHDEGTPGTGLSDDDTPERSFERDTPLSVDENLEDASPHGADSDDELLAQTSEADEATRVVYLDEAARAGTNSDEDDEEAGSRPRKSFFGSTIFQRAEDRMSKSPTPGTPPPSDLDPTAYHTTMAYWRDKITRQCKSCLAAGGIRAERAKWCKGRRSTAVCTFEQPDWSDDDERAPRVVRKRIRQPAYRAARKCKACKRAGGLREARAMFCKGRKNVALCRYDSDDSDADLPPPPKPKAPFVITAKIPDVNPDKLDPKRYHRDVNLTHGGARLRCCPRCRLSGGLREKRSPWCKGRWRVAECTFRKGDVSDEAESTEGEVSEPVDEETITLAQIMEMDRRAQERERLLAMQSVLQRQEVPVNLAQLEAEFLPNGRPPGLDPTRYAEELAYGSNDKINPRACKHCQAAGGRRAELAIWCKGRTWAKQCVFFQEGDDGEYRPRPAAGQGATKEYKPVDKTELIRQAAAMGLGPGYYADMRHDVTGVLVQCAKCEEKGGERGGRAPWCKGRRHPSLCSFAAADLAEEEAEAAEAAEAAEGAGHEEAEGAGCLDKEDVRHGAEVPDPSNHQPDHVGDGAHDGGGFVYITAEVAIDPALQDETDNGNLERSPSDSLPVDGTFFPASPPQATPAVEEPHSSEPANPPPPLNGEFQIPGHDNDHYYDFNDATGFADDHSMDFDNDDVSWMYPAADATEQKMQSDVKLSDLFGGSEVEVPPAQHSDHEGEAQEPEKVPLDTDIRPTSTDAPIIPVEGPPVTYDVFACSVSPIRTVDPRCIHSSPICVEAATVRMADLPFHPTPPPSNEDRSSSVASEQGPCSAPRGILRRRSDYGTPSSNRSAKKTRFSLAPNSPPPHVTPDVAPLINLPEDSDDDELLLRPATSPVFPTQPVFQRSIRARSMDASPSVVTFSRDVSMRAKDIGFNLAQHTGRLSSDMLAALVPALELKAFEHTSPEATFSVGKPATLGSSVSTGQRSYTLPTPPPSTGSTTSTESRSEATDALPVDVSLMLPPPVPVKQSIVRLPTPLSGEGEESDQDLVISAKLPMKHIAKARSRSRSVNANKRRYSSPIAKPEPVEAGKEGRKRRRQSEAPRRRSLLEETLEREAELVEDESFEWGMDEDVEEEVSRSWRAGSVIKYID